MKSLVEYAKEGSIGVITINNPPVNVLSSDMTQGFMEGLARGGADPSVKALVLMGAGRTFVAGADIRQLDKLLLPDGLPLRDVPSVFEGCNKPVIAAIHGAALGGGLEMALGCHFRCAVPAARFGLPEVKLGLLPGAGGTQRLPRLIGVESALDMMLGGEQIGAERALALGLVDEILDGELVPAALEFASRVVAENRPLRAVSRMNASHGSASVDDYFAGVRRGLEKNARGHLAPFLIADCVEAAVTLPFEEGWEKELDLFRQCVESPQSRALVHRFFSERAAPRTPGADPKRTIRHPNP